MIEFDKEFMIPVGVETWYMNLTEANLTPEKQPEWKVMHRFAEEYDLEDLSPSSMLALSQRLYEDADLASLYNWNKARRARERPGPDLHNIDFKCMTASETFQDKDCRGQQHINPDKRDTISDLETLVGKWVKVEGSLA